MAIWTCGSCDVTYSTREEMINCGCGVRVQPEGPGPRKSIRQANREHRQKTTRDNYRKGKKR